MKPAPFSYHRVTSVDQATNLLQELGDEAKLIAGGQSLVAMMNFRLARPSALVDISRMDDLRYIRRKGEELHVGALTRHADFERIHDPAVVNGYEVLQRACRFIGHYAVRSSGTFGGSIAHADPAAEWCMLAVLLDASMVIAGPGGVRRNVAANDFFKSFLDTELAPDEMLVEIRFPRPRPLAALNEFARRHGDFAVVAAAVAVDVAGDGYANPRVVLGGVDSTVVRLKDAEAELSGTIRNGGTFKNVGAVAASAIDPAPDLNGSPEYRRHLAGVLVRRAVEEAVAHAT